MSAAPWDSTCEALILPIARGKGFCMLLHGRCQRFAVVCLGLLTVNHTIHHGSSDYSGLQTAAAVHVRGIDTVLMTSSAPILRAKQNQMGSDCRGLNGCWDGWLS